MSMYFSGSTVVMPSLVGSCLSKVMISLTEHELNVRIQAEKEDADLPSGTVISQMPVPHQRIKKRQTVFLVLSRQPTKKSAPSVHKKSHTEVLALLDQEGIAHHAYLVPSNYPKGYCIAQDPPPGSMLSKEMTLYISSGDEKPILWPNVTGLRLEEALDILALKNIQPELFGAQNSPVTDAYVVQQQPLPGTIVSFQDGRLPRAQLFLVEK